MIVQQQQQQQQRQQQPPQPQPQKKTSAPAENIGEAIHRVEPVLRALLTRLDEEQDPRAEPRGKRLPYRRNDLRLTVTHPGGGTAERTVLGRDLHVRGACIVYEGFLHTGTDCQLLLRRRLSGQDSVRGRVVHCRHLHSVYHLIEIEFREPIVPKSYVDPSACNKFAADTEVDPATLAGNVVMLDDQKIDRSLAAHCLRDTAIKLTGVSAPDQALAAVKAGAVDLILTDLNLEKGVRGEQAIVKLREAGYRGPIIVVSAETNAERIAGAWAAGASAVLQKPYTRQQLLNSISNHLTAPATGADAEPLYSTLFDATEDGAAPDDDTASFVAQFIGQVKDAMADLKRAIADDSVQDARTVCQMLKGTGSSYGFQQVTDAAKDAVSSLDATRSVEDSMVELGRLESLCLRLRATPRAAA